MNPFPETNHMVDEDEDFQPPIKVNRMFEMDEEDAIELMRERKQEQLEQHYKDMEEWS